MTAKDRRSADPADNESLTSALKKFKSGHSRYHSRQRQRGHAAAEAMDHPPAEIPEHQLICGDPPQMISAKKSLDDLLEHVGATGSFAFDTEFIGELSYYPKLCLVQIATAERVAIVDPLAKLNLLPLWRMVADESVETIVHAGEQDLEPVARRLGRPVANVFDTQIAGGFCRLPYPLSLREMVRVLLDVRLGKGATFSQWDRRPLTAAQHRYAADDVRFLPAVRAELGKRLTARGHQRWCRKACADMSEAAHRAPDPVTLALRVRGAKGMKRRNLAVLIELASVRDTAAREHDVPPRSLIPDNTLAALARKTPRTETELAAIAGLPQPVRVAYGQNLLEAVRRGLAVKTDQLPAAQRAPETADQRVRVDSLWTALQCYCWGKSIDPSLVTNRQEFARWCSTDKDHRKGKPLRHGWKGQLLKGFLDDFVAGRSALNLNWSDGQLQALAATQTTARPTA